MVYLENDSSDLIINIIIISVSNNDQNMLWLLVVLIPFF